MSDRAVLPCKFFFQGEPMRERLARFMAGRNGNDQLNVFLLIVDVVLLVLAGIHAAGSVPRS